MISMQHELQCLQRNHQQLPQQRVARYSAMPVSDLYNDTADTKQWQQ
jgi:hypothetical protein